MCRIELQSWGESIDTLLVDARTKLREGRMNYEVMGTVNSVYCTDMSYDMTCTG